MPLSPHWHAYAYTGRSYTDALIRRGETPGNYPPIEIKNWLTRPRGHIAATFTEIEEAVSWLKQELVAMPPAGTDFFPIDERLEHSRSTLAQTAGNDVVYGYYSTSGRYVSRALIACPRRGISVCPERRT
ncbi:hypothetical protein [Streptomyces sp. KLOTTS4A1]|uniref:hypothetical protein n=1 Tax=Streptomyces sp. KLOTTS4A1 TaxID=3390996 RepID=UPI0039F5CD40